MKKVTVFVLGLLMVAPFAFARRHHVDLKKLTKEIQEMAAKAKQNPASIVSVAAQQEPNPVVAVPEQQKSPATQTPEQGVRKPVAQERITSFFLDLAATSKIKRDTARFGYTPDLNTSGLSKEEKQLVKEIKKLLKSHPILNGYWLEFDAKNISGKNLEELKNLLNLPMSSKTNVPQKADKTKVPYYTLQPHNLFGTRFNVISVTLPQATVVHINPVRRSITLSFDSSKVSAENIIESEIANSRSPFADLDNAELLPESMSAYLIKLEEVINSSGEENMTPALMRKMVHGEIDITNPRDTELFVYLTGIVMELMGNGQTPDAISLEHLKEFYQATKNYAIGPYVLPTIAIWHNGTIDGLMPYRHPSNHFWDIPQQAGQMYNTMAQIDHQAALNFLKENIRTDFEASGYLQLWDKPSELGAVRQLVANFFAEFTRGGKLTSQDTYELQTFTFKLLNKEEDAETSANE